MQCNSLIAYLRRDCGVCSIAGDPTNVHRSKSRNIRSTEGHCIRTLTTKFLVGFTRSFKLWFVPTVKIGYLNYLSCLNYNQRSLFSWSTIFGGFPFTRHFHFPRRNSQWLLRASPTWAEDIDWMSGSSYSLPFISVVSVLMRRKKPNITSRRR